MTEHYTVKDFCEIFKTTPRTIYNWVNRGIIPREAIVSRCGHGSKIIINGRAIRHLRTVSPKLRGIQITLQEKYDEDKHAVS